MKNVHLVVCCVFLGSLVMCEISNSKYVTTSTRSAVMSIPKQESIILTTIKDQNKTLDLSTSTKIPIIRQNEITTPESSTRTETTNTEPVIDLECPELSTIPNLHKYTQEELILLLTDGCRYDRLIKPPGEQIEVFFRMDITHIESADHLQLKAHILVQMRYKDIRLSYSALSPNKRFIRGGEDLKDRIWAPHLILSNEKESSLMGLSDKDIFIQINPDGEVVYGYRLSTSFYCWMDLKKFPFDRQTCDLTWVSWAYNATDLAIEWETVSPFTIGKNLHLTEFIIEESWTESHILPNQFYQGGQGKSGNYSAIVFKFNLRREVGYYIMDYFLPSILLVCTSWVTFWLQADASPPRVVLGTSTMLAFITLNANLSKNLPKVSYIKLSEIWFLACTSFIFFSLAEFAFVNVIWRRKKKVELKKNSSKHILKGAITPSLARRHVRKANSMNNLHKTRSCSSLDKEQEEKNIQQNYLTVHSFPSSLIIPTITHSQDDLMDDSSVTTVPVPEAQNQHTYHLPAHFTTMTPQEVAMWIDKKSRIVFPVAFLIFNVFYWLFAYIL
ncbi:pH-sensitive chloride channel 2-like isoform X2 [Diabrotica undecimpunctata]|uniref:pH-sensitive chloride channel 2-like isoform X2 n=1 Tax=Diabrotica undecimpunctata TaxID=50387 RepID=UPI003B63FFE7